MKRTIKNTDHIARHPWPDGMLVQGGGAGVVFSGSGTYRTAFVEAFPQGTFLRGEGSTIAEAEDSCWEQYQRYTACGDHGPFERRGYRNGSGFCTKCGTWMNRVLPELPEQPRSGKPSLLEQIFVHRDAEAVHKVLEAVAHAEDLPTKPEAATEEGAP